MHTDLITYEHTTDSFLIKMIILEAEALRDVCVRVPVRVPGVELEKEMDLHGVGRP